MRRPIVYRIPRSGEVKQKGRPVQPLALEVLHDAALPDFPPEICALALSRDAKFARTVDVLFAKDTEAAKRTLHRVAQEDHWQANINLLEHDCLPARTIVFLKENARDADIRDLARRRLRGEWPKKRRKNE